MGIKRLFNRFFGSKTITTAQDEGGVIVVTGKARVVRQKRGPNGLVQEVRAGKGSRTIMAGGDLHIDGS
ncbi:hypothetical protein [Actinomadura sp. NPDC049753]|uniref:hypothetical protein n=1 Tax=Actinomadura sp. NPDC049753 TaxID=3154739 RepID=UPI0034305677